MIHCEENVYSIWSISGTKRTGGKRLAHQASSDICILVIDDEPSVLDVCSKILKSAGYQVLRVSSVTEALAVIDNGSVTVVLSDIDMPDMTGFELVQELRARKLRLPCVLMSGAGGPSLAKTAEIAGAAAFVGKPFTAPQLLAAIQNVLASKDIMPR
ncbi:response regulator [candidate division GN15 bacterium]|nr:response regulator [candidate division GN15 bacterium]